MCGRDVKSRVEEGLVQLMAEREADPEREVDVRLRNQLMQLLPFGSNNRR